MRGTFFGPHLVKVRDETKSSDEGQSKSFILGLDECFSLFVKNVRDATKSSKEGRIIDQIWSKVRSVTKSSNKGHIIGPHLVKVRDETKSSNEGHILDHIWSKSTA
jgi:hypothetical protein